MTRDNIINRYFEWLCSFVVTSKYTKRLSYRRILSLLHSIDFTYTIELDGNRAADGVMLRYRFGDEFDIKEHIIREFLDDHPCSVLEMMIGLALRCEETIMDNPNLGNRTGLWFWNMIVNMGLGSMTDSKFDRGEATHRIERMINRDYESSGRGGLFSVRRLDKNMRETEIWYQMCWYLNENYPE